MLTRTRSRPAQRTSEEWFANTVIGCHADAYVQYLAGRGYAAETITGYFRSTAHFVHWFARQRVDAATELSEKLIDRFLDQHLPHCRCAPRCWRTRAEVRPALKHLLEMLRAKGVCPKRTLAVPDRIAAELADFDRHLADVRGLAACTRAVRLRHVLDFLTASAGTGPITLTALAPADVVRFVTRRTAGLAPGSIKAVGTSLRSYFLFRATRRKQTRALIVAIPRVAQWRLAGLPQTLSAPEIQRLLNAFDRRTATGQRDYAITRCLLDLGLRRMEVAHLRLEDVDWRAGVLRIHGKGKRIDVLPLPKATGRAIAKYLQSGRPPTTRRELFVRHRPPVNAPANLDVVRNAVRYAAARCGLERRIRGTHIFRYTMARRLMQGGARFKEIADLLRHRSLDTTTIYAKVDLQALARVALPWPGSQT